MSFDTSKARAAIFSRIRQHQKRGVGPTADEIAGVQAYLREHPRGPQPLNMGELGIRFRVTSERMASTVDEVPRRADAPAAVARYLQANGLGSQAVIWPLLSDLDWSAAWLQVEARPPRRDETLGSDKVGITGCFCALAETGTLIWLLCVKRARFSLCKRSSDSNPLPHGERGAATATGESSTTLLVGPACASMQRDLSP